MLIFVFGVALPSGSLQPVSFHLFLFMIRTGPCRDRNPQNALQEVLGYQVDVSHRLTGDMNHVYYALAGCEQPENATNQSCNNLPTRHHLSLGGASMKGWLERLELRRSECVEGQRGISSLANIERLFDTMES